MSRTRIVGGKIFKHSVGAHHMYAEENIVFNSNKFISETGEENGITYGEPKDPPAIKIEESVYKLESTYIHDHIKEVASEMVGKFKSDNTGVVYKLYKEISDGKVLNPEIIVTKFRQSIKLATYLNSNKQIVIWENDLIDIEKNIDKKILLALALTETYGEHINAHLKNSIKIKDNLETYDYDLFRFDAEDDAVVIIGKLETPNFKGNLEISFPKKETEQPKQNHFKQNRNGKGGPSPADYDFEAESETVSGPGDPPLNIGFKFSFSLNGGFSASLYAGLQKEIARAGDVHLMTSMNAALTYFGPGSVGTSKASPHLFNASLTPAFTLGYKTGNALNMNLFNSFSGSGVDNPYEYAFTLGSTGVLSSGKVTSKYDKDGNRVKDPYNSQDNPNRHQIIGGAAIKIGNFMISSYNDIYKLPLFIGMDSDQYWSAGVNIQAKLTDKINMAYAFDLYYGKSNNKNPFNLDKYIDGQNYDHQSLFDILLNRGQETFSYTDAAGYFNQATNFGYGTFWPSNKMHDTIAFPEKPKEPKEPIKPIDNTNEKLSIKYEEEKKEYEKDFKKYEKDLFNFNISTLQLENSPTKHRPLVKDKATRTFYKARTFHHLWVIYKPGTNEIDYERLFKYMRAEIPQKETQEFHLLEEVNKRKLNNEK
ncbi:hypothetical protein SL053_002268 [Flavobacterium psychrophilum]|nr:hypothetical protein [Flavobacterium psychrophilum]